MSPPFTPLWINGSPRASSTQETYDVINSASQAVVGRAARASSEDAVEAIVTADKAQPAWEGMSILSKRDIFLKAAELVQTSKYAEKIVEAVPQETAALESWGHSEVSLTKSALIEAAMATTQLRGETMPSSRAPGGTVLVEKRALGTVFAISPFNSPVNLAARAIGIPLMCGNAVVLKSSEVSPRCAEILVEVMHEAGLPNGVLNLLHVAKEDSPKIVAEIIGHDLVRHINFTGSDRVGKILASEAAKYLKPCVLELGGKAAVIVLDDANVQEAARNIIFGAMFHSGQVCMSSERVLVQRGISGALIRALVTLAEKIRAGAEPKSGISALFSEAHAERVHSLLIDARSRGAKVLVGDLARKGSIVQPHVIMGIEPGWPIWEQESFGPVFGIKIIDTEDEAIELANKTGYTLVGAVWTKDVGKGLDLARKVRASLVNVNAHTFAYEPSVGIHGLGGLTGYGSFDVENFTQRRTVVINPPELPLPFYFNDL